MAANSANDPLLEYLKQRAITTRAQHSDRLAKVFDRAIKSITKYPLPIERGEDARVLSGVGDFVVSQVDSFLACNPTLSVHNSPQPPLAQQPLPPIIEQQSIQQVTNPLTLSGDNDVPEKPPRKRRRAAPHPYLPRTGSGLRTTHITFDIAGGYAVILALLDAGAVDQCSALRKHEVIDKATPFCTSSFAQPANGWGYTAWSSVKQLIDKGIICRSGQVFYLTDQGKEVAKFLADKREASPNINSPETQSDADSVPLDSSPPLVASISATTSREFFQYNASLNTCPAQPQPVREAIRQQPVLHSQSTAITGPLTVELVLDMREVGNRDDRDYLSRQLALRGVACNTKKLSLGDMLWVGRNTNGIAYVLNGIVERKKVDDLVSSIQGSRYREQKFRLQNCPVSQVYYLVEGPMDRITGPQFHGLSLLQYFVTLKGLPPNTIVNALLHTQICDDFHVVVTKNIEETVSYLYGITKDNLENKDCLVDPQFLAAGQPTLDEFNEASVKYRSGAVTVGGIFTMQLMQLPSCSASLAAEIIKAYPTPAHLVAALELCTNEKERKMLVHKTVSSPEGAFRGIGAQLSSRIADLYGSVNYDANF